jgi:hypothetical protein
MQINNKGVIVGDFGASSNMTEGFILRSGSYTKFSVAGSTFTDLSGINDLDTAVGTYVSSSGTITASCSRRTARTRRWIILRAHRRPRMRSTTPGR